MWILIFIELWLQNQQQQQKPAEKLIWFELSGVDCRSSTLIDQVIESSSRAT